MAPNLFNFDMHELSYTVCNKYAGSAEADVRLWSVPKLVIQITRISMV